MYVDAELEGTRWRFVVMNYKKHGRCPRLDQDRYPDLVYGDPNDVMKRTCEEVSSYVGYGDDICRILQEDMLYELLFDQRTMLPAQRTLLGPIREFT